MRWSFSLPYCLYFSTHIPCDVPVMSGLSVAHFSCSLSRLCFLDFPVHFFLLNRSLLFSPPLLCSFALYLCSPDPNTFLANDFASPLALQPSPFERASMPTSGGASFIRNLPALSPHENRWVCHFCWLEIRFPLVLALSITWIRGGAALHAPLLWLWLLITNQHKHYWSRFSVVLLRLSWSFLVTLYFLIYFFASLYFYSRPFPVARPLSFISLCLLFHFLFPVPVSQQSSVLWIRCIVSYFLIRAKPIAEMWFSFCK